MAQEYLDAEVIVREIDLDGSFDGIRSWAISAKLATPSSWKQAIAAERRRRSIIDALGSVPDHAEEFVRLYMEAVDARASFSGSMSWYDASAGARAETDIAEQTRRVILANDRLKTRFDQAVLRTAVDQWFVVARNARVPAIRDAIAFDPSAEFPWADVVHAAFDVSEMTPDLTMAVLRKFVYDVKTKLAGRAVQNHLMPVLVGSQGGGKTTFIRALTRPVAELSREADFARLTDNREIELFRSYVLVLDEMGFASKADIDVTKHVISQEMLDRRPLYTNSSIPVRQCATLIGASNKTIGQLIRDETGNRRFAELGFSASPDRDLLNALDWRLAWASIDENAADPILAHLDELRAHQDGSRQRSSVEEWLESISEDDGRRIIEEHGEGAIRKEEVHRLYRSWRSQVGASDRQTLECQDFVFELHRLRKTNAKLALFEPARGPKNAFNGWRYVGPVREKFIVVGRRAA
jgi:hypothetical protein